MEGTIYEVRCKSLSSKWMIKIFLSTHLPENGKYTEWENKPLVQGHDTTFKNLI